MKSLLDIFGSCKSISKCVVGFLCGTILGWLFYELFLTELEFPPKPSITLGTVISLMLGFGNAFSSQIRCISCLLLPSFCSRGGKGILKSVAITYIIAGPIQNMVSNGAEVVRMFACMGYLSHNLSRANYDLTLKPFKDAIFNIKIDPAPAQEGIKNVKDVLNPIRKEIEDDDEVNSLKKENDYEDYIFQSKSHSQDIEQKYKIDEESNKSRKVIAKNIEQKYFRKLEYRCQNLVSKTEENCRRSFSKAYDDCYESVIWALAWLLCSPMQVTVVCSMFSVFGGDQICDPTSEIPDGFGEGYTVLNDSLKLYGNAFKSPHLNVKFSKPNFLAGLKGPKEAVVQMMEEVSDRKSFVDFACRCFKRILALGFIRIMYIAYKYHENYLDDVTFDNIFITRYFLRIEKRRLKQGKLGVLPLRGKERIKFIHPYSIGLTDAEKSSMCRSVCRLLCETFFVLLFFFIDMFLYQALEKIRDESAIEYSQEGHHSLEITVKGTGIIAQMLRSLLKNFNFNKRISNTVTNLHCLPNPRKSNPFYAFKTAILCSIIYVVTFSQCYMRRVFRVVCENFYRKNEKQRVLFLYNFLLRKRYAFRENMKEEIKKLMEKNLTYDQRNILFKLRNSYPTLFGWLSIFKLARLSCLICKQKEPRKGFPVSCTNNECPVVYCPACWIDIGNFCYICDVVKNNAAEESDDHSCEDSTEF